MQAYLNDLQPFYIFVFPIVISSLLEVLAAFVCGEDTSIFLPR